jgi:hypothetical protein
MEAVKRIKGIKSIKNQDESSFWAVLSLQTSCSHEVKPKNQIQHSAEPLVMNEANDKGSLWLHLGLLAQPKFATYLGPFKTELHPKAPCHKPHQIEAPATPLLCAG